MRRVPGKPKTGGKKKPMPPKGRGRIGLPKPVAGRKPPKMKKPGIGAPKRSSYDA